MQQERSALAILRQIGALITDSHIIYKGGKHSRGYFDRSSVSLHTLETSELCHDIAQSFVGAEVDVTIAPAVNSIVLAYEVARHLTHMKGREVLNAYAEKEKISLRTRTEKGTPYFFNTQRYFSVHSKFITGKNVLVVKDDVTNGISTRLLVQAIRNMGGTVIGVGVICNKGRITEASLNVPKFVPLVNVPMEMFNEQECKTSGPCSEGIPIYKDFSKGDVSL